MALPVIEREELLVSSLGIETRPQSIIAKGSMWTLQLAYGRLILTEYGALYNVLRLTPIKSYKLTNALKIDRTIDADRFWVWVVNIDNVLSLYEFEPYTDVAPVQTYSKLNIDTDVKNVHVYITANDSLRIITLYNTDEINSVAYLNIRDLNPPEIAELTWSGTRLDEYSSFVNDDKSKIDITYLDVASPPNVYTDSYIVDVPANLSAVQLGSTRQVDLSWDAASGADEYLLDRDTNPSFTSPTSIYTTNLVYSDLVSTAGTFYYRIRGLNNFLLLQSAWSSTVSVTLALNAEFISDTQSTFVGSIIQFTDQSIPSGTVGTWLWDFGDGNTSSLQNPTHSYSLSGTYDVTLTVYSGALSDFVTKPNYITISPSLVAVFEGDPQSGDSNLPVHFTDLTSGDPISWDWDFGDGSAHSIEQNPIHTYTKAGQHTVSLTVGDGLFTGTETKPQYIKVQMIADFTAQDVIGPADLTVTFRDLTLGEPTSWDWDFGDGSAHSTEQNPTHTYIYPGSNTVTLIASNGSTYTEEKDTEVKNDFVTVLTKVDFIGSPRTGYQTLSVQFVDTSTGFPTSWTWDFGDGGYSTEQNPTHTYSSPGVYTVTLVASSYFNSDSEIKVGYVIVSGTATPDIAPEPDILLYLTGKVEAYRNIAGSGLRVVFRENNLLG